MRKVEHKKLGMILGAKLNYQNNVREDICKARSGIGIIRYLPKYMSLDILNQLYTLYMRRYLAYGDIIYLKYYPDLRLDITKRTEQTQYSAALAVAGASRGTIRQRLSNELGLKNLYNRRWPRRLQHFFTFKATKHPEYLLLTSQQSIKLITICEIQTLIWKERFQDCSILKYIFRKCNAE